MRVKSFEKLSNFRDFGGYPTRDGARVTFGKLYRSADFSEVSPADRAALDALGVKFVVDLRRASEWAQYPSLWPGEGVRIIRQDLAGAEPEIHSVRTYDADAVRAAMQAAYARYPFERRFISLFRDLLHGLADEEGGPVIVHCAAGKDRTGVACALVLHALGVDRDTIVEDYLLSNETIDVADRLARVRARLAAQVQGELPDDALLPMIKVEETYLEAALSRMEREAGSIDAYIGAVLGVSDEARARLRAHLLAD